MNKWLKHWLEVPALLLHTGGVLLLLITVGCGPTPAEKEFLQMVDRTKQNFKPSDIKQAALPLIGQTNTITLPKVISSLPLFAQDGSVIMTDEIRDETGRKPVGINFMTGSGFGHWGMVVCLSKDGEKEARKWKSKLLPWGDGIYFWIEQ